MIGDEDLTQCTKRLLDVENRGLRRGDSISQKQAEKGVRRRKIEDIKAQQKLDKECEL